VPYVVPRSLSHPPLQYLPALTPIHKHSPAQLQSIAQVHRAVLPSGETIAVKVQRPDIQRHASWDLLAFRILTIFYERWFDLPLSFASAYISEQILKETDFEHERDNLQRIRALVLRDGAGVHLNWLRRLFSALGFTRPPLSFTDDELERIDSTNWRGSVYVPKVYPAFSTGNVLAMEYIEGAARMTDRETIEGPSMGLDIQIVMNTVCQTIGRQIFRWGFLNADPHVSRLRC
jgi:aarF domain-containing kinase